MYIYIYIYVFIYVIYVNTIALLFYIESWFPSGNSHLGAVPASPRGTIKPLCAACFTAHVTALEPKRHHPLSFQHHMGQTSKHSADVWKTGSQEIQCSLLKISFGGIPNSRNILFLHISEACCEAKRWKPCWTCWTRPGPAPKIPKTFSGTFSATFSGTRWTWLGFAPRLPGTFSGTFSGALLSLTWLCTKPCLTWPGSAPKPPWPSPEPSQEPSPEPSPKPVEHDLALHQSLPDLLRNLLRNSVEPDLALHQGFLEPSPEPSLNLTRRLHQCTPELFWAEDPISLRCWGKMMISSCFLARSYWLSARSNYIYIYIYFKKMVPKNPVNWKWIFCII